MINPYESPPIAADSVLSGSENDARATLPRHAFNFISASVGCVLGAYIGVAIVEGLDSALQRGIPTARDFLPLCVTALATMTIWRWLRFRSTSVSATGPVASTTSGAFAVCSTYLAMTQLDSWDFVDPLLPWFPLPIFLFACIIVVEIEATLRRAVDRRGIIGGT